jgi:hypothetical protein
MPLGSAVNTTPPAAGEFNGGGLLRQRTFRRRVPIVHGSAYAEVGYLPSNVMSIVCATMAPVSTGGIAVAGGLTTDATNAANTLALTLYPTTATAPLTAPASTSSSSAATNVLLIGTGTTTTVVKGPPVIYSTSATNQGSHKNTNSCGALLTLQPANTNSQRLQANGTSAFVFGTDSATSTVTYSVDVYVTYWEYPSDAPSFTGGNL